MAFDLTTLPSPEFPKMQTVHHFHIPEPSANRFKGNRKFVVECISMGIVRNSYEIDKETENLTWSGPHELDHFDELADDGSYWYRFFIEFSNSTGTRKEKAFVHPLQMYSSDNLQDLTNVESIQETVV